MTIIKVPKPPKSAFNKDRRISNLLRAQLEHLQQAEFRLPARQQTDIYVNAIKTEGEAAEYIRRVMAGLYAAHAASGKSKAKGKARVPAVAARGESPKTRGKGATRARTKGRTKVGTKRKAGSKRRR